MHYNPAALFSRFWMPQGSCQPCFVKNGLLEDFTSLQSCARQLITTRFIAAASRSSACFPLPHAGDSGHK